MRELKLVTFILIMITVLLSMTAIVFEEYIMLEGYIVLAEQNDTDNLYNNKHSISGGVFRDEINNSIWDSSEEGISDVIIRLYDNNDYPVAETISNETGRFSFNNLPGGLYKVGFLAPDNSSFVEKSASGDFSINSFVSPDDGLTAVMRLDGKNIINVNAGIRYHQDATADIEKSNNSVYANTSVSDLGDKKESETFSSESKTEHLSGNANNYGEGKTGFSIENFKRYLLVYEAFIGVLLISLFIVGRKRRKNY